MVSKVNKLRPCHKPPQPRSMHHNQLHKALTMLGAKLRAYNSHKSPHRPRRKLLQSQLKPWLALTLRCQQLSLTALRPLRLRATLTAKISRSKEALMSEPLTIGCEEICASLGICQRTLYRIRKDPTFPQPLAYGKVKSKRLAFDRASFNDWYRNSVARSAEPKTSV